MMILMGGSHIFGCCKIGFYSSSDNIDASKTNYMDELVHSRQFDDWMANLRIFNQCQKNVEEFIGIEDIERK